MNVEKTSERTKYLDLNGVVERLKDPEIHTLVISGEVTYEKVTRCADCTFCYIKDMTIGTCDNRWGMNGTVRPDDYCSRGRKRDKGAETR